MLPAHRSELKSAGRISIDPRAEGLERRVRRSIDFTRVDGLAESCESAEQ
jgi:hypothetical protein